MRLVLVLLVGLFLIGLFLFIKHKPLTPEQAEAWRSKFEEREEPRETPGLCIKIGLMCADGRMW